MHFYCATCNKQYPVGGLAYECECGGLFKLHRDKDETIGDSVSLGEVKTPLLARRLDGIDLLLKADYLSPTGSFKDRGAYALINALKDAGITEVVEDSSGNAGAAIAGYCAAAGIKCHIYLPEATSQGKIKQINAYKASVVKVPGSRDATARAILQAAESTYYASHVYNPLFFEGTKSLAYEIYAEIGVPDTIVVPAGNGTMLLGIYIGFKEIGQLPQIIAVQSASCAPVYAAFHGLTPGEVSPTAAEGIAVGQPKRLAEMVAAVRESGGTFLAVDDASVLRAQELLGEMGLYIEATSGAAVAGALEYFKNGAAPGQKIVVPLTGTGLKK
ncbi:MAG: pyridoxal-phosphate dependent enzyme [Negativicutes bacterium]|nr:pyridoxal-phosphate dependent enzyme [Negativicutes bacterium]